MNLDLLVARLSEAVPHIDRTTTVTRASQRTGRTYLQGAKSLNEPQFVREAATWWANNYADELPYFCAEHLEYAYPEAARATCDLMICKPDGAAADFDWALEIKHIALVGDNGKNNDYGLQKLLSPYLKDRSLVHDAHRLRRTNIAPRRAVVMYGFDYDADAIERARTTCAGLGLDDEIAANLSRVLKSVDPVTLTYRLDDLIAIADASLMRLGLINAPAITSRFNNANRHPCGGEGIVAGWEVLPEPPT
jgi:hypothetical protein